MEVSKSVAYQEIYSDQVLYQETEIMRVLLKSVELTAMVIIICSQCIIGYTSERFFCGIENTLNFRIKQKSQHERSVHTRTNVTYMGNWGLVVAFQVSKPELFFIMGGGGEIGFYKPCVS